MDPALLVDSFLMHMVTTLLAVRLRVSVLHDTVIFEMLFSAQPKVHNWHHSRRKELSSLEVTDLLMSWCPIGDQGEDILQLIFV